MGKNSISLHFSESWKLSIISYVYGPYIFLCEIPINVFCSILYWLCLFIIIFIVLLKILNVFFIRNLYLLYVVNVVSPIIVYLFTSFKYKQKMSLPPPKKKCDTSFQQIEYIPFVPTAARVLEISPGTQQTKTFFLCGADFQVGLFLPLPTNNLWELWKWFQFLSLQHGVCDPLPCLPGWLWRQTESSFWFEREGKN